MCQSFFFVCFFCCNLAHEGAFSICTVNKVTVFHWFQQMCCDRKWIAVKHELCFHQPFREGKLFVESVRVPIKLKSSLFFKHTVIVTVTDALQLQGLKQHLAEGILHVPFFILFFCVTLAARGGDGPWQSPRPSEQSWERCSDCVWLPEDQSAVAVSRGRGAHVQVVENTTSLFSASYCI